MNAISRQSITSDQSVVRERDERERALILIDIILGTCYITRSHGPPPPRICTHFPEESFQVGASSGKRANARVRAAHKLREKEIRGRGDT